MKILVAHLHAQLKLFFITFFILATSIIFWLRLNRWIVFRVPPNPHAAFIFSKFKKQFSNAISKAK